MILRAILALLLLALAPAAFAKTCKVAISSNDAMQFDTAEIRIGGDCTQVELTLKHTGKMPVTAMGHNWVLAKTAEFRSLAIAGQRASAADSYLPKDDARVIAHTTLVGGGESATVTFATSRLQKGGDYTFFCSFPGHWNVMKGKLVFG
ncbi:MAG: azurin [Luteimonas sp.]|nr:azurin [Luteimonas sp.]